VVHLRRRAALAAVAYLAYHRLLGVRASGEQGSGGPGC
jgi:hypothetical protein